ncbi:MAG: hypothetical protein N2260_06325 [Syntrophobacterales bacterium]|nr:hypothetical protein [Syntrophobacterales bacterium]
MRKVYLVLLIGVVCFSGCYFHGKTFHGGPYPKAYVSILTNIKPFDYPWQNPPSDTTGVYVISVDGREVPSYIRGASILQEIEVMPGKHRIELLFHRTLGYKGDITSPDTAVIEVETKPDRTYLIDARIDPIFQRWYPIVVDMKEAALTSRSFIGIHDAGINE